MSGPRNLVALSRINFINSFHLVVPVCRGVAGEPYGGLGEGPAAGQHEGSFQLVLRDVAFNKTGSKFTNSNIQKMSLNLTSSERI